MFKILTCYKECQQDEGQPCPSPAELRSFQDDVMLIWQSVGISQNRTGYQWHFKCVSWTKDQQQLMVHILVRYAYFPWASSVPKWWQQEQLKQNKETTINVTRECFVVSNSTPWGQSLGLLCYTWQENKLHVFPSFLEMDLSAELLGMPNLPCSPSPTSVCNSSLICACS